MSAQQEYKELYAKYKAAIGQLATVTAERDRARAFQPMITFKPKEDKLQEYLVLFGDADIDVATYENSDNPEERAWYHDIFGPNEVEIFPYGWMELPEPIVKESPND